jgi:hypothetical protein
VAIAFTGEGISASSWQVPNAALCSLQMPKPRDLDAEHKALLAEHAELETEHRRLQGNPRDLAAHQAHIARLRDHIKRLHAYMEARGISSAH